MEFGISTTFLKKKLTPAYIDRLRDAGLSCLEIGARDEFIDTGDRDQVPRLRRHLEKTGFRVHSVHAPFRKSLTIGNEDRELRERAVRRAGEAARLVTELGGDIVVVHVGTDVREVTDLDAYRARVMKRLPRLVEAITSEGARVAIENQIPGRFTDQPDELAGLVEQFDSALVGACIDTGHAHRAGRPDRLIRRLAGRILATHIHDGDPSAGQHLLPPLGTVDWDACMRSFREADFAGPFIFEVGRMEEAAFDALPAAMDHLRGSWRAAAA